MSFVNFGALLFNNRFANNRFAATSTRSSVRTTSTSTVSAIRSPTINPPLVESGASGSSPLDIKQRGAVIGEVIPIVFCRRVGDIGGVLISPPATEARFDDDAITAAITASYHLVLSDGDIESIQVRDVFQRSCRVGDFTQTYSRRAGTFIAGNFIDNSPNLEAPYYCGTGGSYDGMSTMAFSVTIPAGFDQWNRQVHCFIRGGVLVTRLLDSTLGPSNNVVDLALYLLQKTSRLNAAQIDSSLMMDAARFTNANGLWYNGAEDQSANLRDWLKGTLDYFLLRSVRINGKETFKPLLPYIPATGAINTDPVEWVFTFTEEHIVPDSFEINYIPLTERKPFCALMLWRQQPTDDIGIIRTSEVRYPGTALDGPFEQYDLSKFCASEDHAWKAGTYIISRRRHITHTLAIQVKPDAFNPTLVDGDIVRVRLDRVTSVGAASVHNYLYEVDRITKSIGGDIQIELTHFPVDSELRSVVALEVDSAVGGGVLLETGKTGVSCDVNSSTDTSVPDEEFTDGTDMDDGEGGFEEGGEVLPPDPEPDNPDDDLDDQRGAPPLPMQSCPVPGGNPAVPPSGICEGAVVTRRIGNIGEPIGLAITQRGGEELYSIPLTPPEELGESSSWNGRYVEFFFECPDGTEQYAEPCESPGPKDWPDFDDYEINFTNPVTVTITSTSESRNTFVGCRSFNLGFTFEWIGQFNDPADPLTLSNVHVVTNVTKIVTNGRLYPREASKPCDSFATNFVQLQGYNLYQNGSTTSATTRTTPSHLVGSAPDDAAAPYDGWLAYWTRTSRCFGTSVIEVDGIGPIYPDPNANSVTYET
jgi:hypothetical protein